jgi:hypothetical protein
VVVLSHLFLNAENWNIQKNIFTICFLWVLNMVSYFEGRA